RLKMNCRRNGDQRERHPRESRHQQWLASGAVDQRHAEDGCDEIDRADDDVGPKRAAGGLVRNMLQKDNRAVVNDGIDSGELAEQGDDDGNDQRFSERGIQQVSALLRNGGTNRAHFFGGDLRAANLRKETLRLAVLAFLDQLAGTFRKKQQRQQKKDRGDGG